MKAKLLNKNISKGKESYTFENTVKARIPIAKAGFTMSSKRDRIRNKRTKITVTNWEKI